MPTNTSEMKKALRGLFGGFESDPTTGSSAVVENLIERLFNQTVHYRNDHNHVTLTAGMVAEIVHQAPRAQKLKTARYAQSISTTVSTSVPWTLSLIKRKSPSYSLTFLMASLAATTATLVNKPLGSTAFTLSSLSAEQELAAGDTVTLVLTESHAFLPRGLLTMEFD